MSEENESIITDNQDNDRDGNITFHDCSNNEETTENNQEDKQNIEAAKLIKNIEDARCKKNILALRMQLQSLEKDNADMERILAGNKKCINPPKESHDNNPRVLVYENCIFVGSRLPTTNYNGFNVDYMDNVKLCKTCNINPVYRNNVYCDNKSCLSALSAVFSRSLSRPGNVTIYGIP